MSLWKVLKDFFKPKVVKVVYEYPLTPKVYKRIPFAVRKELAELRGERDRLEQELEELRAELEKIKKGRVEEEAERARKLELLLKAEQEKNREYIFFDRRKKRQVVSLLDGYGLFKCKGVPHPYWIGIAFENIDNIPYIRLVLSDGKREALTKPVPLKNFPDLFPPSVISDLRTGKVPIYMRLDGRALYPNLPDIEVNAGKWHEEIKKMYESDFRAHLKDAPRELIDAFEKWVEFGNYWMVRALDTEAREKETLGRKLESDIASETTMKMVTTLTPHLTTLTNKMTELIGALSGAKVSRDEAIARMAGAEAQSIALFDTLTDSMEKIRTLGADAEERIRERLIEEFEDSIALWKAAKKAEKGEGETS